MYFSLLAYTYGEIGVIPYLGDMVWCFCQESGIGSLSFHIPVPGIFKCFDLRLALRAVFVLEEHIVGAVGVKRRVKVNKVNALAWDVLAQNKEVVAIE